MKVAKDREKGCGRRRRCRRAIPSQAGDDEVPVQRGAPVREEEGRGREDSTEVSRSGAREYPRAPDSRTNDIPDELPGFSSQGEPREQGRGVTGPSLAGGGGGVAFS